MKSRRLIAALDAKLLQRSIEACPSWAWPLVAIIALGGLLVVPARLPSQSRQAPCGDQPETQIANPAWGERSGGLRMRITPIPAKTYEQKPNLASIPPAPNFAVAEDITFVVELQNVSDKPISLQGVRYGNSADDWGLSRSDWFAPMLFSYDLLDNNGKMLNRPLHHLIDADEGQLLTWGLIETLAPGKSLVCSVRPADHDAAVGRLLVAGQYQLRLHYHGPSRLAQKNVERWYPDHTILSAWTGDVVSVPVAFSVADGLENRRLEPVWGPVKEGLCAAVRFRGDPASPQARRDAAIATFPIGTSLGVEFEIKNVSDETISFITATMRWGDQAFLIDGAGKESELGVGAIFSTGQDVGENWTLKPGHIAVVPSWGIKIVEERKLQDALVFGHADEMSVKPGLYKLRYELRNGLITGNTPITVRARKAEDDPPSFPVGLRFQSVDGKAVESGALQVFGQAWSSKPLAEGEIKAGAFEVPRCSCDQLRLEVRAPGYEETQLYDVPVERNRVASLTLKPADPTRLRLVTSSGQPIAGAKVRLFSRSTVEATFGPRPKDDLKGPVWATSNAQGDVVLDTLKKIEPLNPLLGNNVYWFYVEPMAHAPFFLGPVQAGQDLGKMTVSPYLEVRGEVHGTPAELAAFEAAWGQPYVLQGSSPAASWTYAESQMLETKREGDKLTFHLTGLRPGTLRIVSRFKKGGDDLRYDFAQRVPNKDDLVHDVRLTASRNDLVVRKNTKEPR